MKRMNYFLSLGISFFLLSTVLYVIHFAIFKDAYFIFKYMINALAFLPINVFLVTIVLNSLLGNREKRTRLNKLNMVIGAFFTDIGTDLLKSLSGYQMEGEQLFDVLNIGKKWADSDFSAAKARLTEMQFNLQKDQSRLITLKSFLVNKRPHLLRLLENPSVLENESFANLLWAISHLSDELMRRKDMENLYPADLSHLTNDVKRIYTLLLLQWVDYMNHLMKSYPHLFSLAVRTNPFTPDVSVEIMKE